MTTIATEPTDLKGPADFRHWWGKFFIDHPHIGNQFDVPIKKHARTTLGGKLGCTHECIAAIIAGKQGIYHTHDEISEMAGYPTAYQKAKQKGMYDYQVTNALNSVGLDYRVVWGWEWWRLERRANFFGPVIVGVAYSHHPEWQGYEYLGTKADGKPNGYALPHGQAGKNQLTGFDGLHAELLLGANKVYRNGKVHHVVDWIKDPNHRSTLRPESPPFDKMYRSQGRRMYEQFAEISSQPVFAVIPVGARP